MQEKPRLNEPLSHDLFYMWRAVIAIAHADGVIHEAERGYLDRVFAQLDRLHGLTPEQKKTFASDIIEPKSVPSMLRHINDPAIRGQLVYFAGLMAHADGALDPIESAILAKLRADQLDGLDLDNIRAAARHAAADEVFRHELSQAALRPQKGLIAWIDALLMRLGIDILG